MVIGKIQEIGDLVLFVNVVETGGISSCARQLGYERGTVSRRIRRLELSIGTPLLKRSTKNVTVTDAGRRCFEQCAVLLDTVERAKEAATEGIPNAPSEPIVIGAPAAAFETFLKHHLERFVATAANVRLEMVPVGAWSRDLLARVDIGLALAPQKLDGVESKTLSDVTEVVCASPGFLQSTGRLDGVQQLADLRCVLDGSSAKPKVWNFLSDGELVRVKIANGLMSSGPLEAREAAIAGLGVCRIPRFMCKAALDSGQLLPLFPSHQPTGRRLVLLSRQRSMFRRDCTELRLFLERGLAMSSV
ncbi:MAG: LysR family transcriptional regulator [Pseudomonadota bacterium]